MYILYLLKLLTY